MKWITYFLTYCIVYMIIGSVWQSVELIMDKTITERKVDTVMTILISIWITTIVSFYENKLNK